MNLYRVPYVLRTAPDAAVQEKIAYVVAHTPEEAAAHVNSRSGCEAMGSNVHTPSVEVAAHVTPGRVTEPFRALAMKLEPEYAEETKEEIAENEAGDRADEESEAVRELRARTFKKK